MFALLPSPAPTANPVCVTCESSTTAGSPSVTNREVNMSCIYGPGSNGDAICTACALRAAAPIVLYEYANELPSLPGGATSWSSSPTALTNILALDSVDWLSTYNFETACKSASPFGVPAPARSPG